MPLKIRCPHCHRVLIAEDQTAGQQKLCPACGQVFNVPLPSSMPVLTRPAAPSTPARTCPHCRTEVGPTASYCHKCHADLSTGKRLPLGRRLRLLSWRFWTAAGLGLAGVGLAAFAGVQFYLIRSQPAKTTFVPTQPRDFPAAELAEQLLRARSPGDRQTALEHLGGVELRATPAVAAALAASLGQQVTDPQARWNRVAAIDLLARHGKTHPQLVPQWLDLLARCQQDRSLYVPALRARAVLGDAGVLEEVTNAWLTRLERLLLLSRVVRASQSEGQPGVSLLFRQFDRELVRCAEGLRALAQDENSPVFQRLAGIYWDSWDWLGQGRGDRLADEVFNLARPADRTLEFRAEDVRGPREVLRRVAETGSPAVRAAAGLILEQRGPQYKTVCRGIAEELAKLLPDSTAADQQRLTWAITRLRGKLFGVTARADPLEVTEEEIAAAQEWANPGVRPTLKLPYRQPPLLTYRAVTAARLIERDLLNEMRRGWPAARAVVDGWLAAGLGCTPRIHELLNPGQRHPNYPALAAALILTAEYDEQSLRPQLELWREATDQPAWVRALAYTVLGSLDTRRGRWDSGWPLGLELGDPSVLDSGQPGWEDFGRVLATGGQPMRDRLANWKPAPLPAEVQAKLLEAAERATGGAPPPPTP
jgi:phage FluMu protein Com